MIHTVQSPWSRKTHCSLAHATLELAPTRILLAQAQATALARTSVSCRMLPACLVPCHPTTKHHSCSNRTLSTPWLLLAVKVSVSKEAKVTDGIQETTINTVPNHRRMSTTIALLHLKTFFLTPRSCLISRCLFKRLKSNTSMTRKLTTRT